MAAAILTAVVDVACGYAAMTLMPPGSSVVTIEYKANFLAPARGERMVARGRVIRPGRTVTVCAGDVIALEGATEKLVATLLATMMRVAGEQLSAIVQIHANSKRARFGRAINGDTRHELSVNFECWGPVRRALLDAGQSKSDLPYGIEIDSVFRHWSARFYKTHRSS